MSATDLMKQFLERLCEPSGWVVADCGIAGEVSSNGVDQVRDYSALEDQERTGGIAVEGCSQRI
jgi:hypothetical protein